MMNVRKILDTTTASSLNSRVNFRLSMTHLLLHKTPNLVSSEPGAAHIKAFFPTALINVELNDQVGFLETAISEKALVKFSCT